MICTTPFVAETSGPVMFDAVPLFPVPVTVSAVVLIPAVIVPP